MRNTLTAVEGREIHHAINPGLAEFDRRLHRQRATTQCPPRHTADEAAIFRARAQNILRVTLRGGC